MLNNVNRLNALVLNCKYKECTEEYNIFQDYLENEENMLEDEEQYKRNYVVISDRRKAIQTACMMSSQGDIILVAGKGHETYQEIKGVKNHFNDKEIIAGQFMLNNTNLQ